MWKSIFSMSLVASLSAMLPVSAATIYKWYDAAGQVHYSNQKPAANVEATIVDTVEPVRPEPTPKDRASARSPDPARSPQAATTGKRSDWREQEAAFQQRRAARLEQESRETLAKEEDAVRMVRACDRARASLARAIAAAPRLAKKEQQQAADIWVYYPSDYVETPSMNNAERSQTIESLEGFISKNCKK